MDDAKKAAGLYKLLAWLSADPEEATQRYDRFELKLVTYFTCERFQDPYQLAAETIDRVIRNEDVGNPTREPWTLFKGIAVNVGREERRRQKAEHRALAEYALHMQTPSDAKNKERHQRCLDECMGAMQTDESTLLARYYEFTGRKKIEMRRSMAFELGITLNALRLRINRNGDKLNRCLTKCVDRVQDNEIN